MSVKSLRHFSNQPDKDTRLRRGFIESPVIVENSNANGGNLGKSGWSRYTIGRPNDSSLKSLDSPLATTYYPATENMIGTAQLPVGVAGPVEVRVYNRDVRKAIDKSPSRRNRPWFDRAHHRWPVPTISYVTLATTEGVLVASVNRGCKVIRESGGAQAWVTNHGITRAPVLMAESIEDARLTADFVSKNISKLNTLINQSEPHIKIIKIAYKIVGTRLFLRINFNTDLAMGMNMATIASQSICEYLEKKFKIRLIAISSNFRADKKSSWHNLISGRGREVNVSITVKPQVIKQVLKTTPQALSEVYQSKLIVGSYLSGSSGFNAHFANVAAAMYIATGQDPAHVVEASQGIVMVEPARRNVALLRSNRKNVATLRSYGPDAPLTFTAWIPNLIMGLVGGGTKYPTQQACLSIINHQNSVDNLAAIVGTAMLAGEISLLASLAEGSLGRTHAKLGRKVDFRHLSSV